MSPINAITLQRRLVEVGRIRLGQVVPTSNGKTRPEKLSTFRFTSPDRLLMERVAAAYGGTVQAWTPANGGASAWEVLTDVAAVPVLVPPQSITQWMECWAGGGATRRCDGETEVLSDSPCLCAAAENMECKPTTRLSVLLRDIEGLGSFRLESKGWNAAAELPGMAELLARAGGYVQARLYLKAVRQVTGGQTRDFMVPALAVDNITPAQLLSGQHDLALAAAPPVAAIGGEMPAIGAAPAPNYYEQAAATDSLDEVRAIFRAAQGAGHMTPELTTYLKLRAAALTPRAEHEQANDTDLMWMQVVSAAPEDWTTTELHAAFAEFNGGVSASAASAHEMRQFAEHLEQVQQTAASA